MKRLFIVLAAALTLVGCVDNYKATERTFKANSTVNAYFKFIRVEEGKALPHPVTAATMNSEELYVMFSLVGDYVGSVYDLIETPYGENALAYEACQEKFGDFNPNSSLFRYYTKKKGGEWVLDGAAECIYYCFSEQIKGIKITSNRPWTEGYPIGTDLAPLFTVEFSSLAEYVSSGFQDRELKSYRCIASELDTTKTALMLETDWNIYGGTDMAIHTATIPEDMTTHTLTIALTLDSGETVSYDVALSNIYL
ncbi:MAG: hypothetical protein IJX65_04785 [Alistipes sp.]|nr:hypothetical protein [Alistipes sp.]